MYTKIKANKDLYNGGKCFTKGKTYQLRSPIKIIAEILGKQVTNDLGEPQVIGTWYRNFSLVKDNKSVH
jgi:hypothetical protein